MDSEAALELRSVTCIEKLDSIHHSISGSCRSRRTGGREAAKEDWQALLQVALGFRIAGDSKLFSECFEQAMDGCPEGATKAALKQQFEMLR